MRRILRALLLKPILWISERFTSEPDRERIFEALSKLFLLIETKAGKQGFTIPFETNTTKFIIFSDQHKGNKDGADDFALAEPNYLAALRFYNEQNFHFISLGDSEELWENTMMQVINSNEKSFALERKFVERNAFTKIFGNHDLDWDIDPLAPVYLKQIYKSAVVALEGIVLKCTIDGKELNIFCTHGHQGDLQSDGNWFSKFFVSKIWAPLQAFLRINPNTPAYDTHLKTKHNAFMYEWSSQQKNIVLITGHTHQPVFESLTHLERLNRERKKTLYESNKEWAEALDLEISWRRNTQQEPREDFLNMKPSYFNSGCCCYSDGDITGIEIEGGYIRLVKWKRVDGISQRIAMDEKLLSEILKELTNN
jgi:predicted phosphodiesterase